MHRGIQDVVLGTEDLPQDFGAQLAKSLLHDFIEETGKKKLLQNASIYCKTLQDSNFALEVSRVSCPRRIPTQFVYYILLVMQLQSQPHKSHGILIPWCSSQSTAVTVAFSSPAAVPGAIASPRMQPLRAWLIGWLGIWQSL